MADTDVQLVTEAEMEQLAWSVANFRDQEGFTQAEVEQVVQWAEGVRLDVSLLGQVLDGALLVAPDDEGEMVYKLSPAKEAQLRVQFGVQP